MSLTLDATAESRVPTDAIVGPSAWTARTFDSDREFTVEMPPPVAAELRSAALAWAGAELTQLKLENFALSATRTLMDEVREELRDGRGFLIVRGVPIEGLSLEQINVVYWLLGLYLGKQVSQSAAGERIAQVTDRTRPGDAQAARGYTSRRELPLHTDGGDYMGLLCVRAAKRGGLSLASSVHAIFNTILSRRPHLLPSLFRGHPYHRKGEQPDDQPAVTPHDVAVLGFVDDRLGARYVRSSMTVACEALGRQWDPLDKEALDCFDDVSWDSEHLIQFMLKPGDLYLANNWLTLHSRTEFEDHERPEDKRLFLRMWCQRENPRSRVPHSMCVWENPSGDLGIDGKPGGRPAGPEYLKTFKQRAL